MLVAVQGKTGREKVVVETITHVVARHDADLDGLDLLIGSVSGIPDSVMQVVMVFALTVQLKSRGNMFG